MYTRVQRVYQLVSPRPLMVAKFNSNTFIKKFLSRFVCVWLQSLQKSNTGIKNTLNLILIWNPLKKFNKKTSKKISTRKSEKWSFCSFISVYKSFQLITFLGELFCIFNGFELIIECNIFIIAKSSFCQKICRLISALFCWC